MDEVLVAQLRHRHEAVRAGLVQPYEQAETGDAGDPAVELRADAVGQEGRHISVVGVALCGHGPALGEGDALGGVLHLRNVAIREAVGAQAQRRYQSAVHDQVGVAADGRGEVGVPGQVQPEVADVLGGVDRLHLGPQDHLVDDLGVGRVAGLLQQLVEAVGARRLALRPRDAQRLQEVDQRLHLLRARGVVDAVDQRRLLRLQGLGGRDVRLDHHLLDQLVGLQRRARQDRVDTAHLVDVDAALQALDGQRRAGVAAFLQHRVGRPQRGDNGLGDRPGLVVGPAVGGGLRLLVGKLGRRPHQATDELVAALAAVGAEDHANRHAGAILALAQAAEAVGQHLRQHRLHAVGKVDAVGLLAGRLVERGVRSHVGRDIGDGHPDDPAAGVFRVVVGLGEDRVVVVARVGGVDGDEGDVAQVLAAGQGRRLGRRGFGLGGGGEAGGDAVGMDGDQRGGARLVLAADDLQELAALGTIAGLGGGGLGQHQIAVAQFLGLRVGEQQAVL